LDCAIDLTKLVIGGKVIMALGIQGHWYFWRGCQPDFSNHVNLIVEKMNTFRADSSFESRPKFAKMST
jgi:hypothetical protein